MLVYGLRRPDADSEFVFHRCREVQREPDNCIDLWARGHYKAVDVDEPVPTPSGWKRHGDLEPGDLVYGPDGKPTPVVARTEVFEDADCYLVTFDDGYSVVVSGEHLWTVEVSSRKRMPSGGREGFKVATLNTRSLGDEVYKAHSTIGRILPRVPVASAVQNDDAELPIDPYVLGVWLGDGNSDGNRVTQSHDDADAMQDALEACGASVSRTRHSNCVSLAIDKGVRHQKRSSAFTNSLREFGLLNNKHIPTTYLNASEDQRFSLLQGLMDTDGSCNINDSSCIFCSADPAIAAQVLALASSLGLKASLHKRFGEYKGKPRPYFQVHFLGIAARPPFRMQRKADRCTDRQAQQTRYRRVVTVERVESRPVSCVQVARDDGLYLIGSHYVATHNSTIITFAYTIFEILNNPELTFGIFSFNRPIAKQFLRQIKTEFETNELLKWAFDDILYQNPKGEALKWSEDDGITVKRKGNPKEATVEAWGLVDGQPTSKHFKRIVYDDVVTDSSVTTAEQIKKTTMAWSLSRNLVSKDAKTRVIGTRYAYFDTYDELIKRGFKVRKYQATKDGAIDGEPWLLTREHLQTKLLEMGSQTFAAQMMQEPRLEADAYFKPDWFKRYVTAPKLEHLYCYGGSDFAVTKNGGDWTVHGVVGIDADENIYVLDVWRERTTPDVWVEAQIDLIDKYKPMAWGIPRDQIAASIGPQLRKRMQERKVYADIRDLTEAGADKVKKARSIQARTAQGKLYLPAQSSEGDYAPPKWLADFEQELLLFPLGKHDDQVDFLSIIGRLLDEMVGASVPVVPKPKVRDGYHDRDEYDEDNWKMA